MMQQQESQHQQGSTQRDWLPEQVKEALKDSSWVTIAWDWFQTLLGRAVDAVLWATMVFSCYQLIPGATQPAPQISSFAFILQFIALDIGGLGLNRMAQQQGLDRWSYSRGIAYILISITLVTVTVAGIERAVQVPDQIKAWIEVLLVIARSVMTVLYGQAIHNLKHQAQSTRERIAELEAQVQSGQREVSSVRRQLESEQRTVSSLRVQLSEKQQEVDTLTGQVNTLTGQVQSGQREVSSLKQQANSGQSEMNNLRSRLTTALAEAEGAHAQLSVKQREVEALQEAFESEQRTVSRLRERLDAEQAFLFSLSQRLDTGQQQRGQVPEKRVSSVQVSSVGQVGGQVDTGQVIDLDATRAKRKGTQNEGTEHAMLEQVREVLREHPGLSARAIAKKLSCSPTTAAKWKDLIEREQQRDGEASTECVNE